MPRWAMSATRRPWARNLSVGERVAARRALRSARRRATRSRGDSFEDEGDEGGGGSDVNVGDEDWKEGVVEVKRVKVSEAGLRDILRRL